MDNLNDNYSKKFTELLSSYNLVNSINFPTHVKGHSLDLVLTRSTDTLNPISIPLSFPSDHCLIKTTLDISKPLTKIEQISYRPLKKINLHKFKDEILKSELFSCNFNSLDINEIVDIYNSTLLNLLNRHAPLKTITIKKKENSPWYSDSLRNLKKTKRYFEDMWLKYKSNQSLIEFKTIKNQYIKECNLMKTKYYSNKITECGNDSRKIYKVINTLCQGNKTEQYPNELNNQTLCNKFNDFFSNKVQSIVTEIDNTISNENLRPNVHYLADNSLIPFHHFTPFSNSQVEEIIKTMKKKTSKLDPLPHSIFSECVDILISPLATIINKSLCSGIFPDSLKQAVITPIIKSRDKDLCYNNFRPISNTPFLSKLIEKVALSQFIPHLNYTQKFALKNSAYKAGNSTETLLCKINSDIMKNMDSQKITILVLLDLSAAFDSISQHKLIQILQTRFQTQGNALNWFKSYILNRTQSVSIQDSFSSPSELKFGVPQGSCIGPVAFLAYTSAISEIATKHNISIETFADDTQLYTACNNNPKSIENSLHQIEQCISDVRIFLLTHQLKINDSKTEFLFIGTPLQLSRIDTQNISITVGNSTIKCSSSSRNLGFQFDCKMSFDQQIKNINRKSYFQLTKIKQIKKYLSDDLNKSLVHSLIFSNLDYCNILYYNMPNYQINKLQKIQNSAARILTNTSKYSHITPVLRSLHWLPVKSRIEFKILVFTYKCLNSNTSSSINTLITQYQPARPLRSSNKNMLVEPKIEKVPGSRSFHFASPHLWNKLPEDMKQCKTLSIFKKRLKTHLFSKSFN